MQNAAFVALLSRLLLFGVAGLTLASASTAASAAPRTIVVFGDSQAQGVAAALRRLLRSDSAWRIQDRSKPGTSIGQSAGYDWPATVAAYCARTHADIAVLLIGGNDRLSMHLANGNILPFRSDPWRTEYKHRLQAILRTLAAADIPVLWLGNPITRDRRYSDDMAYLNDIVQDALAGGPGRYISLWSVIADQSGRYTAYAPGLDGQSRRMRLDDGIHFTPDGYDVVAARVVLALQASYPTADDLQPRPIAAATVLEPPLLAAAAGGSSR